jgi:hypothetical protein
MQTQLKFLLSFLKRDWQLTDYPTSAREQFKDRTYLDNLQFKGTLPIMDAHRWVVRIPGWYYMVGFGPTKDAAYLDLNRNFEEYKAEGNILPRPGTSVPLKVAPRDTIETHDALAEEFFQRILGMNYHSVFITDSSSVYDFNIDNPDALNEKIEVVYNVSVRDIEDGNLARIFDRIAATS